ncbi:hypothetical protein AVEN_90689-1, partial [Araneus ventricosus]
MDKWLKTGTLKRVVTIIEIETTDSAATEILWISLIMIMKKRKGTTLKRVIGLF